MSQRTVLVLGATGLVGRELVSFLLRETSVLSVIALTRRPLDRDPDPKLQQHIVDFDAFEQNADVFRVDQVFCALGTTIRVAGSQEQFRRVDHDYPVHAARLAHSQGAKHYLLVSALGANAGSRVFYNRVKGETEDDIRRVGIPSVTIARPSLLTGPREEFRLGERIGQAVGWLLPGNLRPIQAKDVAAALTLAARESRLGVEILSSRSMRGASLQLSK
jgi:uncharacterized protein YbjT (DUF2867 family)